MSVLSSSERTSSANLAFAVGSLICGVPLGHVVETMRPLPIEALSGMPEFILGLSMIRGIPTPVVDLGSLLLLNAPRTANAIARFVLLRLGSRRAALAVNAVIGVREIDSVVLGEMPPLVRDTNPQLIEAVGALDTQFLVVLQASRLLSEEAWQGLAARGARA